MEKYTGTMTELYDKCISDIHNLKVHYINDGSNEPYFLGYCTLCGFTTELPVRKIEEVFNNDR